MDKVIFAYGLALLFAGMTLNTASAIYGIYDKYLFVAYNYFIYTSLFMGTAVMTAGLTKDRIQ